MLIKSNKKKKEKNSFGTSKDKKKKDIYSKSLKQNIFKHYTSVYVCKSLFFFLILILSLSESKIKKKKIDNLMCSFFFELLHMMHIYSSYPIITLPNCMVIM